jgi:hypothetical protein
MVLRYRLNVPTRTGDAVAAMKDKFFGSFKLKRKS